MRWGGWHEEHLDDVLLNQTNRQFPWQSTEKSCDHVKKSMTANHFKNFIYEIISHE